MKHQPSTAPGAAALVAGIEARQNELSQAAEKIFAVIRIKNDEMRVIGKELSEIQREMQSLEKMKRAYLSNGRAPRTDHKRRSHKREAAPEATQLPGATDAVLNFMLAAPSHRMARDEATDRLQQAILAGAVGTRSTDPLKMAGTTIGNMIRTGYLKQEGNDVVLLLTSRKRKGRPGTS